MRAMNVAVILAATGLLPGCATVVRGNFQDVSIVSEPPAALASASNGMSCTTPCKLELDRRQDIKVTVSKSGYMPSETQIVSRVRGSDYLLGIGGDLVAGGIIGAVVDGTNGSLYSLEPSPLRITLQPYGSVNVIPAVRAVLTSAAYQAVAATAPAAGPMPCAAVPGAPQSTSHIIGPAPGETGNVVLCGDPYRR